MTSAPTPSRSRLSPALALGIVLLAVAAWGVVYFLQLRKSPAQQHIDAGNEYARKGDGLNAVKEWEEATRAEPNNAFAWQLLGQSYFEGKRWKQAQEALLQVERLAPATPRLYSLLATTEHSLGELPEALKYAHEALKKDPNDIPALETCVAVQTKMGDAQEIIGCLRKLTELEPNKVEHPIALAEALAGQNSLTEVLPVADRILQLTTSDPEMYILRGIARFYTDGTPAGLARAEEDFTRADSLRPQLYAVSLYLGRIYRRRGQMDRAQTYLERAVQQNSRKADAFFDLAAVYERTGQSAKAADTRARFQKIVQASENYVHLRKRCDLAPNDFDLHMQVATLALRREDLPAARYYLQRAYKMRPNDAQVLAAMQQMAELSQRPSAYATSASGLAQPSAQPPSSGGP